MRRTMDRLHRDVIIAVVISGEDAKLQLNQVNILQELNYGLSLVRISLGWRGLQSCRPNKQLFLFKLCLAQHSAVSVVEGYTPLHLTVCWTRNKCIPGAADTIEYRI